MNIAIVEAKRSPIGSFGGKLSKVNIAQLTSSVIKDCLGELDQAAVSKVILGHVLTGGFGQNTARQAALAAGIESPAYTINAVCGSGMKAIMLGCYEVENDQAIVVGGHELMSQTPHHIFVRNKPNFGNITIHDSLISDGLTDVFNNVHMGMTAEHLAMKYSITREMQDEWAYNSQLKASKAAKEGIFANEITPITLPDGSSFDQDEYIRHDASVEKLAKLRPAFIKDDWGTITAGNASGINDGSAVLILMKEDSARKAGLKPLARIVSFAEATVDPMLMGIGPVHASKKALERAGWSLSDVDLIELNEAFAAQVLSVNKLMEWDIAKVNVNGGAIALGHPIGASGARIVVSLLHELLRKKLRRGLATTCVGGGMGSSICIEII
jgi:acetyl-CoA C-acetyltransferase